jgi:hypothetical protein
MRALLGSVAALAIALGGCASADGADGAQSEDNAAALSSTQKLTLLYPWGQNTPSYCPNEAMCELQKTILDMSLDVVGTGQAALDSWDSRIEIAGRDFTQSPLSDAESIAAAKAQFNCAAGCKLTDLEAVSAPTADHLLSTLEASSAKLKAKLAAAIPGTRVFIGTASADFSGPTVVIVDQNHGQVMMIFTS